MATPTPATIPLDRIVAAIFDTDGVVTDTARVHAAAWKQVFDAFFREESRRTGTPPAPFDIRTDYLRHVDGRSRLDGVRAILADRRISLPEGRPTDDAGARTVCGLGNAKDAVFLRQIRRHGVAAYPGTVALLRDLRRAKVRLAAVSASRNCAEVLRAAGVSDAFDVRVDGVDMARLGLPGKPHPALFLEAAHRLGVPPQRTAVIEDALAGVEAAGRGGFGLVIAVDRGRQHTRLRALGADLVVDDLDELRPARSVG